MRREPEKLTPEEKYKNSRKGGIALIVIGALMAIAFLVVHFVVLKDSEDRMFLYNAIYGAVLAMFGGIMLAVGKNKYKKAQEQSQAATSAAAQPASKLDLSSVSSDEDEGSLREENGKSFLDIISHAEDVSKITLCDGEISYTADFLWCNAYDGVWFFVIGRDEDGNYTKYILRVDKSDPTVAHYEMNDNVREVIIDDFAKAVSGYAQQNGYTAQATGGQGRIGRLKSRFKSGEGEDKKTRVTAFVSVAVMYAVILIVGLALYFARIHSAKIPPTVIRAIALGYLLVLPSFLLYFGAHNPFNLKPSVAKLFRIVGIGAMIACDAFGLMRIPRFAPPAEYDAVYNFIIAKFIPIALFVATVAYILVYIVWCKGLSSKWFAGASYGTTVLFPVATALMLAVIALYIAWTLLIWLISSIKVLLGGTPIARGFKQGWTGKRESGGGYQIIDEHGYTRTLTPYEGNRYRDDTGSFWVSDDGGNTFRRD